MLHIYENGGFELNPADYIIEGLEFVGTCGSYPEQYDVVMTCESNRYQVGYVRLRGGRFAVSFPDAGWDNIIYEYHFDNKFKGSFENETERLAFLNIAASEINKKLNKE